MMQRHSGRVSFLIFAGYHELSLCGDDYLLVPAAVASSAQVPLDFSYENLIPQHLLILSFRH